MQEVKVFFRDGGRKCLRLNLYDAERVQNRQVKDGIPPPITVSAYFHLLYIFYAGNSYLTERISMAII